MHYRLYRSWKRHSGASWSYKREQRLNIRGFPSLYVPAPLTFGGTSPVSFEDDTSAVCQFLSSVHLRRLRLPVCGSTRKFVGEFSWLSWDWFAVIWESWLDFGASLDPNPDLVIFDWAVLTPSRSTRATVAGVISLGHLGGVFAVVWTLGCFLVWQRNG